MFKGIVLFAALATGLAPMASAQLSSADKAFVMKTAQLNNYEIRSGQMAQEMSTNDAYKSYAQMIVTDHTKAGQELTAAVASADPSVQLPTDVTAKSQADLDTLKNAGSDFDMKYRQQMISSHAMLHSFFQSYLQRPNDNAGVKQVIESLQPVVTKHWNDAKKLPRK